MAKRRDDPLILGTSLVAESDERVGRRRWTRELVERTRGSVTRMTADHCAGMTPTETLAFLVEQIDQRSARRDRVSQLQRLAFVFAALEVHAKHGILSEAVASDLQSIGFHILDANGVHVEWSRLAFLHADLFRLVGLAAERRGSFAEANWGELVSLAASRRSFEGRETRLSIATAKHALRAGDADRALFILERLGADDRAAPEASAMCLAARRHREGHLAQGEALLRVPSDEAIAWEALRLDAMRRMDCRPLVRAVRVGRHHLSSRVLEAFLHTRAGEPTSWLGQIPSLRVYQRRQGLALRETPILLKAAKAIEHCYDQSLPVLRRLVDLGEVLPLAAHLPCIDTELVFLAAAARWLSRIHAWEPCATVLCRYRRLALTLSGGRSTDTLGLVADLLAKPWFLAEPIPKLADGHEDQPRTA